MSTRIALRPFALIALLVAIACSDENPSGAMPPAPVATITVNPTTQTLIVGATATLTASLADAAGNPITDRSVAWQSDRPDIATVTAAGLVTAVAAGVATIGVSSENMHATAQITVTRTPVARVDISPATLSLVEGEAQTLTATPKDENGAVLGDRLVAWRSSDIATATIDAAGRVTAIRAGTAAITAESEGKAATLEVTVSAVPVASVVVSSLPTELEVGDQPTLGVRLTDAAGRVLTGRTVTWTTSNTNIATVSAAGIVTARAVGNVTITATSEGKTGSATTAIDGAPIADLIYGRNSPGVNQIFTLGFAAGSVPKALNAGSVSSNPTPSADGSRFAFFVSMVDPVGNVVEDIYAVDKIGTNIKRLTTTAGVDDAPAWSPTANVIAYHHRSTTGRSDIWLMNSDGTASRNLTADLPGDLDRADPAWSPDGQWIAFASMRRTAGPGRGSIWITRADGTEKRELTVHPGNGFDLSPSWSPDGQRIAFQRGGISIVTVATGEVTTLDLPGRSIQPAWSPDGRHIAFAWSPAEPGSGVWELYTVRPDGTGMRLRTTNPQWGGGVSPAWIPR